MGAVAKPNKDALKFLKQIGEDDRKKFGQLAIITARDSETPRITGDLARSEITAEEGGFTVLKTRTGYGAHVHFGTTRQQANPFFARAVDRAIPEMRAIIKRRNTYRG